MGEKTPVSVLQELCIKYKHGAPFYEEIADGSDESKTFSYAVQAFGATSTGSGRTKREAKHTASANLIGILRMQTRFKDDLPSEVPSTPRPTSETDAVGLLLDICVQRNWPIPSFHIQAACGTPHAPEFTIVCELSSIKRQGTFSTKKGAKQLAAKLMLDVVQSFDRPDEQKQVATFTPQPVEKILKTYRELKKSDIKPVSVRFSKRHNYFMRFPQEQRNEVYNILYNDVNTERNAVDLVCKALKIPYDVTEVTNHPKKVKMFVLRGDFDCVLTGNDEDLWLRTVSYFKTMLNFEIPV